MELESNTKVRQSEYCAFTHIVGKAVVVFPRERSIHRLDEVGTFIWDCLAEERTCDGVASRLMEEFDVDRDTAVRDAREFLEQLLSKHLIEVRS